MQTLQDETIIAKFECKIQRKIKIRYIELNELVDLLIHIKHLRDQIKSLLKMTRKNNLHNFKHDHKTKWNSSWSNDAQFTVEENYRTGKWTRPYRRAYLTMDERVLDNVDRNYTSCLSAAQSFVLHLVYHKMLALSVMDYGELHDKEFEFWELNFTMKF